MDAHTKRQTKGGKVAKEWGGIYVTKIQLKYQNLKR